MRPTSSSAWQRASVLAWVIASVPLLLMAPAAALGQGASPRLFLKDGTSVPSYGEYARVGDRVVFTVQLGEITEGQPRLQLVTLAASEVDWARTEEYYVAVRASRYAATRGETDYAELTSRVAEALRAVAAASDPARRLEIVEQARREVADWPRSHYAYRARDVAQISALLDEAVSELRAAAGSRQFDLNLVASTETPLLPVLPPPTPAEAIGQVLGLARRVDVPAERLSLLNTALSYAETASNLAKADRSRLRREVRSALDADLAVERKYTELNRRAITEASRQAAEGDVRGVEEVLAAVARSDERLGRKRPEQVSALLATVEAKLDAARRFRLARDQWQIRSEACRQYAEDVKDVLRDLTRSRRRLEDIKKLAGPDARALAALEEQLVRNSVRLAAITPPEPLGSMQALLASSIQLARQAVAVRQQAVKAGDVGTAWNASSAAAGSMMLLERARQDMDACLKPPQLR